VYALGQANFLFDPVSEPYVTADELSDAFGVAKSTMGRKARQIRDLVGIDHFSPEFLRADVTAGSPMVWMLQVDGLSWMPGWRRLSQLLTGMIKELADQETGYALAKARSLALLEEGRELGTNGQIRWSRDDLHER
jgi:hypothetical protein